MIAMTSRDPKDWVEDSKDEAERSGLLRSLSINNPEKNARILRTYYPLKARLKKQDAFLGFQPGTVLTVEPGIYIPKEGFGIRLENNIVVRPEGAVDLFEGIPIEAEEIENLMQ